MPLPQQVRHYQEQMVIASKLKELVGGTILTVGGTHDGDDVYPVIGIRTKEGEQRALILLRDPEGNGPGWFDIVEDKELEEELYEVICQEWEESERGWGVRPDGFTLYLNEKARDAHIKRDEEEKEKEFKKTKAVPDEYSRPSGKAFRVKVPKDVYEKVKAADKKTKVGGYIWGDTNSCPYEKVT